MNDKTLVERLRDEAKRAREERGLPVYTPEKIEKLADAIEREYLPKPRFEDGEPVQFGDEVFIPCAGEDFAGEVCEIAFDGEEYRLKNIDGHIVHIAHWESVKRPEPEVLDADGVSIKIGDTVFNVKRGTEYKVTSIHSGIFEVGTINVDCNNAEGWYKPECLTHKQPDSLERIEKDAKLDTCAYFGHDQSTCDGCCMEKIKILPCDVEKALDLLRRQRKVLERGR